MFDFAGYLSDPNFSSGNDEIRLANYFDINKFSFTLPAAVIASLILAFVVFKVIPPTQRLTFMISGLIGGFLGFYLWLHLLGPILMP